MNESNVSEVEGNKQLSGRIILCAMIALFLGLLLCLVGIALQFNNNNSLGGTILTIGQLLLGSWLLLLFMGIAARLSLSNDEPKKPLDTPDSSPQDLPPST